MPDREPKNSLAGVSIGDKGDELPGYLGELAKRGVSLYPETLSRIRGGFISGSLTTQQLLLHQAKAAENIGLKTGLYLDILSIGLENRSHQTLYPGRYLSNGFTQAIAEQLEFSEGNIRGILRAMRADLVLYCGDNHQPELVGHFVLRAEDYLLAYAIPPSTKGADGKVDMLNNWERDSVLDFYKRLYSLAARRAIGTWVPYEIEVFSHFYQLQQDGGWLTPLDRLVFEGYVANSTNNGLIASIREKTATDFNSDSLIAYANALSFGKPFNPIISANKIKAAFLN